MAESTDSLPENVTSDTNSDQPKAVASNNKHNGHGLLVLIGLLVNLCATGVILFHETQGLSDRATLSIVLTKLASESGRSNESFQNIQQSEESLSNLSSPTGQKSIGEDVSTTLENIREALDLLRLSIDASQEVAKQKDLETSEKIEQNGKLVKELLELAKRNPRSIRHTQQSAETLANHSSPTGQKSIGEDVSTTLENIQESLDSLWQTINTSQEEAKQKDFEASKKIAQNGEFMEQALNLAKSEPSLQLRIQYWQNALRHAEPESIPGILAEFGTDLVDHAESLKTTGNDDFATVFETLARIYMTEAPPAMLESIQDSIDKVWDISETMAESDSKETTEVESDQDFILEQAIQAIERMLSELDQNIDSYEHARNKQPMEDKILHLSATIETSVAQFWSMDRTAVSNTNLLDTIDEFPHRLANLSRKFTKIHDDPVLEQVRKWCDPSEKEIKSNPSFAKKPHQTAIDMYSAGLRNARKAAVELKGPEAAASASDFMSEASRRMAEEKKAQLNEYQLFVANICRIAHELYDDQFGTTGVNTGHLKKGTTINGRKIKNEKEFTIHYFCEIQTDLGTLKDRQINHDSLIKGDKTLELFFERKTRGVDYFDVHNEDKAFGALALLGFFRVDQTALLPETNRIFGDVLAKYYESMTAGYKAESVKRMVESPKIRLEDF